MKWLDTETEKNINAKPWYTKTKKPKLFGLIDGTHVPIACPRGVTQDENQYYCYKGYYSINAMVREFILYFSLETNSYLIRKKNLLNQKLYL